MNNKFIQPRNFGERMKFGFCLFLFTTLFTFIDFIVNIFRSNVSNDMDWLSWLYYIPASLGHASLFALVLFIIFYIPFALIFKNYKVATWIYIVPACLMQIIVFLDGFIFSLYRFHFNGFVLELILGGGTEVFEFNMWLYIKFTLFVLLVAVLPYIVANAVSKRIFFRLKKRCIRTISIVLLFCIVFSHLAHAVAAGRKQVSIQKSATAMPFFFPLTANSLLLKLGISRTDAVDEISYNLSSSDVQYPIHPIVGVDSVPNYNVVYIVIDSWSTTASDSTVCPNISQFAKKGQSFDNHFSASYGTRGSILGLFFGMSATYEKEIEMFRLSPAIIDRMLDLNYNIQTFPSATFTTPPFHDYIYKRVPNINVKSEGKTAFDRDNYITDKFTEYIHQYDSDKPFFSFVFYDLPHAISIPEEHRKQFTPSWDEPDYLKLDNSMDPTPFFNLYRNCIYYTDQLVGNVVKTLEDKGMLENTVIVITGDHAQEFNENKKNYWGHGSNFTKWQLQVPFVLYYPGIEAGQRYSHMTTHYDVTPTIMNRFLGVTNPTSDYSMGHDLSNTVSRYPHLVGSYANYGFVFENMIVNTNHLGTVEITDKGLNPISRKSVNALDIKKAIDIKNQFYKK